MAKIAFVGGGNMASCIFNGIRKTRQYADEIIVSGPHVEKLEHFAAQKATVTSDNVAAVKKSDVIFLGVKPQMMMGVIEELRSALDDATLQSKLFISMAAGFKVSAFKAHLGNVRLIRIMPNTPSKLGLGVTALYAQDGISPDDVTLAHALLEGLGTTIDTSEDGLNTLGAVAGSGPAFVFRFMEAMIAQCVSRGFSEAESRSIVEQMFVGASQMAVHNQDMSIAGLREAVTSKGGTTYQGLLQMSEFKFEDMMQAVIDACLRRTHEFEDMFK